MSRIYIQYIACNILKFTEHTNHISSTSNKIYIIDATATGKIRDTPGSDFGGVKLFIFFYTSFSRKTVEPSRPHCH